MSPILALPDHEVMAIVRQLRVGYGLKRTLRYNTSRNFGVHNESVGEHVFALHYLLEYFARVEVLPRPLDWLRVHTILTFHDFGEIPHGDKPYHLKTAADEEQEREDAKKVFASLPQEIALVAQQSWQEYENKTTLEGKFAYALDKVEPVFELLDPVNEKTFKRIKHSYQDHVGKKLRATAEFPVMRRFVEVTAAEKLARDVFWRAEAAE